MQPFGRSVKRPMLDHRGFRFSNCVADGGRRCFYLRLRRILIKMAEAFFSSSWRILELDGCADLDRYAGLPLPAMKRPNRMT